MIFFAKLTNFDFSDKFSKISNHQFVFIKKDFLPKCATDDDNWQKDEPIECPKADSWSGIVPIIAKITLEDLKKKELEEQQMLLGKKRKTMTSSHSKKSTNTQAQKSDSKPLNNTNSENISQNADGIASLRLQPSKSAGNGKKLKLDQKVSAEEQSKQDHAKLVQGLIDEREKEFEKKKQTMRGKQYVYNRDGEPIEIKKIAPSALPEQMVVIDATVKEKKKPAFGAAAAAGASPGKPGANQGLNIMKPVSKKLPAIEETKAVFSMISGIKPAAGVTIKDGTRVLKGNAIPRDNVKEEL